MQTLGSEGLERGWDDVITILSPPTSRGYLNDSVMPNLFLSNHDGYRVADHFNPADPQYYEKLMTRHAILAAYPGPVTLYYGDEYADRSVGSPGAQKDNIARTTGHLKARNAGEQRLKDYISKVMKFRGDNPAVWRGEATFHTFSPDGGGKVQVITKKDPKSANKIAIIFSDTDTEINSPTLPRSIKVKALVPEFITL